MSVPHGTKQVYPSMLDQKTATRGVYRRGNRYRVLTRPYGKRKVMRTFKTYEEAVAFKATPLWLALRTTTATRSGAAYEHRSAPGLWAP